MSSVASSSATSIASSWVTMPTMRPVGVDHRQRDQVVARDQRRRLLLLGVDADRHRVGLHDLGDGLARAREQDVAQRHHAEQPVVGVDDIGVVDRLDVGGLPPQRVERLRRGQRPGAASRSPRS